MRNEDFLRDLKPLLELYVVAVPVVALCTWMLTNTKGGLDREHEGRVVRLLDGLCMEMVQAFFDLLKKWPKSVWLFFPDSGAKGMIQLWRRVYGQEFPSQRVIGKTGVGTTKRLRPKETLRAFNLWDEFRTGKRPVELAPARYSKRPKSNLMTVLRALKRAHRLIYGTPLPTDRRQRRLTDFDPTTHMQRCQQCKDAWNESDAENAYAKMCQRAKDYANEESGYLREKLKREKVKDDLP